LKAGSFKTPSAYLRALGRNTTNYGSKKSMSKKLTVLPTSRVTADCDPIVLRETETTRLVFKPMLVDNANTPNAVLRGWFVFQKKSRTNDWAEYKTLHLSHLRDKEWVKLEIHASELLQLYEGLNSLYDLYQKIGIPRQKTHFLKIGSHLEELLGGGEHHLEEFLKANDRIGFDLLSRLLNWAIKLENSQQVIDRLEQLHSDSIKQLNTLIGLNALKNSFQIWETNRKNSDEEFWQRTFTDNSFVFSQIFAYPILIICGKAYVGGKLLTNRGGNIVDFLAKNNITKNAVLIEIKTPATPLLGSQYRTNAYSVSSDITGAIVQVSNYRNSLIGDFNNLNAGSEFDIDVFNPQCLVIAGDLGVEADNALKRKSFELFRTGLRDVQVISYDELFQKVKILIDLLEGNGVGTKDDEIPF